LTIYVRCVVNLHWNVRPLWKSLQQTADGKTFSANELRADLLVPVSHGSQADGAQGDIQELPNMKCEGWEPSEHGQVNDS
jgi:hypothetical protein